MKKFDEMSKRCIHHELRRARDEATDALLDTWYCPEPGCDFEIEPWAGLVQLQGYKELVMAVARKFPGESRHQTALRYIREAEASKTFEYRGCRREGCTALIAEPSGDHASQLRRSGDPE